MTTENAKNRRIMVRSTLIGVIVVPLVMFVGTAIYLYRETADIRGLAATNAANIARNIETIKALREQVTRVEEEQKRRTGRVEIIEDLKRRVERLERRR